MTSKPGQQRVIATELWSMVHQFTINKVRDVLAKSNKGKSDWLFLTEFLYRSKYRNTKKSVKKMDCIEWVALITKYNEHFTRPGNKLTWAHALDIRSAANMLQVNIVVRQGPSNVKYMVNAKKHTVYLHLQNCHFEGYDGKQEFKNRQPVGSKRPPVVNLTSFS